MAGMNTLPISSKAIVVVGKHRTDRRERGSNVDILCVRGLVCLMTGGYILMGWQIVFVPT